MIALPHAMPPDPPPDIYPDNSPLSLDEKIERESRALEEFLHLGYCLAKTPASEDYHDLAKMQLVHTFLGYTRLPENILSTCGPYAYSLFCSFFKWHPMSQVQVSSGPLTGEQTIHSFIQMAGYASVMISDLGWCYLRRLLARAILEPVMFMEGADDVFNDGLISGAMEYCLMVFVSNDPECGAIGKTVTSAFDRDMKEWDISALYLNEHIAGLKDSGQPEEWETWVMSLLGPTDDTQIKSEEGSPCGSTPPLFHDRVDPGAYPLTPVSPTESVQERDATLPPDLILSPFALELSSPTLGESPIMLDDCSDFSMESLRLDETPETELVGQAVEEAFERYMAAITQQHTE